jgi:hypothetical protein
MIIFGGFMINGWLRITMLMLALFLGNLFSILILTLGCVYSAAFIFWHILHSQFGMNGGTWVFFMILLYALLIIYTIIAAGIRFLEKRYKMSLLLSFVPMLMAFIILLFFIIW